MPARIYRVDEQGGSARLVMAQSAAEALRYVTTPKYKVRPASPSDVAEVMGKGAAVEAAEPAQ